MSKPDMAAIRREIENLRIHATQEEKDRLDEGKLNMNWTSTCIYGQMTGDCDSKRGCELRKLCAKELKGTFYSDLEWFGIEEAEENQAAPLSRHVLRYIKGIDKTLTI